MLADSEPVCSYSVQYNDTPWEAEILCRRLNFERGIVSMRVALCYDLLRFILGSMRFVQLDEISYLLLYGNVQL